MKKLFLILAISGINIPQVFAQPNNPQNQHGIEYIQSIAIIDADIAAGKRLELSESELNTYSKTVPLKNQISITTASSVVSAVSAKDYKSILDKSSLTAFSKNILSDILFPKAALSEMKYKAKLVSYTDIINTNSDIANSEKEMMLSMMAIAYNSLDIPVNALNRNSGCTGIDEFGNAHALTHGQCVGLGAAVGALIGYSVCGVWCGLGGAIVGGVVVHLSLK